MNNVLADTHCHLDFQSFDQDRAEVLLRAEQAGIIRILNPGIDLKSSQDAVNNAKLIDRVYAAVGVHPNDALTWDSASINRLAEMAQAPKVVGIGEIGLDYYWDAAPAQLQREILHDQLDLAAQYGLPVILHLRDKQAGGGQAWNDLLEILKEWTGRLKSEEFSLRLRPGVLHSFSGDVSAAESAVKLGFWIGIGGPVTYKNSETLRDVVRMLPDEKILVETDAPFLPPQAHRGRRNEPAFVRLTADKVAELRGVSTQDLSKTTTENAARLFLW